MAKWLKRIVLSALLIAVIGCAAAYARFVSWRNGMTAGLSEDTQIMQTTRGPVEYTVLGEGVPVLWIHGTPGGYDQTRAFASETSIGRGYRSITVSRPGYLRTPITSGESPDAQAQLFASLLDSLNVERVAVIGISGGGPSALQFARLFPQRTQSLVLVMALTKGMKPAPTSAMTRALLKFPGRDFLFWLSARRLSAVRDLDPNDRSMVQRIRVLAGTFLPESKRRSGTENDFRQFETARPLDGISAPTLIIAGTLDVNVPFDHADYAMAEIPGARLLTIEGDHYAMATHADEVWGAAREFVLQHAQVSPATSAPAQ